MATGQNRICFLRRYCHLITHVTCSGPIALDAPPAHPAVRRVVSDGADSESAADVGTIQRPGKPKTHMTWNQSKIKMLDELKQPEYTGENRCLPCTGVNLLIAVVAAAVAGRRSRKAGAGVFVASVVLIYLRGYLVPGTPQLTKRYLPDDVLRVFGKEPARPAQSGLGAGLDGDGTSPRQAGGDAVSNGDGTGAAGSATNGDAVAAARDEADALDPELVLLRAGALEECEDGEDLCLTDQFKQSWDDAMADFDGEGDLAQRLVAQFDLDVDECEIEAFDDGRVLTDGDGRIGQWPSEAAMIADAAGAAVLRSRLSGWDDLSTREKGSLLNGLRLFLEECPTGDGGIEFGQETVESCCSSYEVVAVTCEETGDRLFEEPIRE